MQDTTESAGPVQQKGINTELLSAENMFCLENSSNRLSSNIFNILKKFKGKTFWSIRNTRKCKIIIKTRYCMYSYL